MALALTAAYVVLTFLSMESFPELAPYRIQLILGIAAVIATLVGMLIRGEFEIQRQVILMAGFTAVVVLSWLPHGWVGGSILALQLFMPAAIVFFLTAINVRSARDLRVLRFCLVGVTFYLVGRGLFDYFLNPENSPFVLKMMEFDIETLRLQALGLLGDPNNFAQFLLAMLPLLLVGATSRGRLWRTFVLFPAGAVLLMAIYYTHSRGAITGLVVLAGLLAWRRLSFFGGVVASAAVGSLLVASSFAGGGRSVSIDGGLDRLAIWSDGLGMFKSSPLWGVGFNGFTGSSALTAHNSFLLCAVELGFIGFFLWVGLLLISLWQLRRAANSSLEASDPELRVWANAILLSLTAFLVPGFFLSETYAPMLYLLLGMSTAIARLEMERTGIALLPDNNHWAFKTVIACVGSMSLIYIMVRLRAF